MDHYEFKVIPLPYKYDAIEPYIDTLTMQLHHDGHLKTYVDNLNKALKDYPIYHSWTLEQLIYYSEKLYKKIQTAVLHNAGGIYNHNFFFQNLQNPQKKWSGNLADAIDKEFNSFEDFKKEFTESALSVFGSGYTYLVLKDNKLKIINLANQDTPLVLNSYPVICVDVWEHAYYLKNHNIRANYLESWFNVVNYESAEKNYNDAILKGC